MNAINRLEAKREEAKKVALTLANDKRVQGYKELMSELIAEYGDWQALSILSNVRDEINEELLS